LLGRDWTKPFVIPKPPDKRKRDVPDNRIKHRHRDQRGE
jgi:hypothetical protein